MSTKDIRLRLVIRRHAIPDVRLVWPCSVTEDFTIAQLLARVNEVIQLETDDWGLEDYAVELGGAAGGSFECLHFQRVGSILKEDDEVVYVASGLCVLFGWAFTDEFASIRSLLGPDMRRRRRSGRHQISGDGTHLVDGIAFGKPWHRAPPDRPDIFLPPRKRARITYDSDEEEGEAEEAEEAEPLAALMPAPPNHATVEDVNPGALVLSTMFDDDDDEADEDYSDSEDGSGEEFLDADVDPFADEMDPFEEELNDVLGMELEESDAEEPIKPERPLIQEVESDGSELGDDMSLPEESDSESTSSSGVSSSDESSSDSGGSNPGESIPEAILNVNGVSDNASLAEEASSSDESSSESSSEDSSSEESSDDSSDDSDDSDSDSSTPQEVSAKATSRKTTTQPAHRKPETSMKPAPPVSAPGQGLSKTQKRNARRKKAKQNQFSFEDRRRALLSAVDDADGSDQEAEAGQGAEEAISQDPVETETVAAVDHASNGGEIDLPTASQEEASKSSETARESQTEETPRRRMRIDLGAGRRMLFGSLGLKNPKTKADEEKLKKDLMKGVRPLVSSQASKAQQAESSNGLEESQPSADVDVIEPDESWRDKINYRAVECCREGIELSEPPFPFVQRWDPQQKFKGKRKRNRDSLFAEGHDEDESRYFDAESQPPSAKRQQVQQKRQDANHEEASDALDHEHADSQAAFDDLPALPADLETLPLLDPKKAQPGTVITWKQWQLSKATNWQPTMISATAMVLRQLEDSNIQVILAKRDREQDQRQYDEQTGKRIYESFEQPGSDDEEAHEDDGYRDLAWTELMEARIVQQPPPAELLAQMEQERQGQETQPSAEHDSGSISIQSGQKMPHLDLVVSNDVNHLESTRDSETREPQEASEGINVLNSPSMQLYDESQLEASKDVSEIPLLESAELEDGPVFGDGQEDDDEVDVPSSLGSPRSGRQPHSVVPEPGAEAEGEDMIIPETLITADAASFAAEELEPDSLAEASSPFPSLDEVIYTASQVAFTQPSPLKMETGLLDANANGDDEYAEAMRQLDDGGSPDVESGASKANLFPNATQPEVYVINDSDEEEEDQAKEKPTRRTPPRNAASKARSKFTMLNARPRQSSVPASSPKARRRSGGRK